MNLHVSETVPIRTGQERRTTGLSKGELLRLAPDTLASLLLQSAYLSADVYDLVQDHLENAGSSAAPPDASGVVSDEPYMVGDCPKMQSVFDAIRKFAPAGSPVLITGESGTGKELVARALHERSPYASGPFVPINCAGVPPTLIASELFGHEKGAFTGAHARQTGRIEAADGGTLFLDEIGDLAPDLQAHLLRFLEDHTIQRIGGRQSIRLNVRVVAATNVDLGKAIGDGRFREDLYYRLNVLSIHMPPLRERGTDVELLSRFFLRKFGEEMAKPIAGFNDAAMRRICAYHWPGNVRELISKIRSAVVMTDDDIVGIDDLSIPERVYAIDGGAAHMNAAGMDDHMQAQDLEDSGPVKLSDAKARIEAAMVRKALARSDQNIRKAAEELGVSRVTLYRLMERHGVSA